TAMAVREPRLTRPIGVHGVDLRPAIIRMGAVGQLLPIQRPGDRVRWIDAAEGRTEGDPTRTVGISDLDVPCGGPKGDLRTVRRPCDVSEYATPRVGRDLSHTGAIGVHDKQSFRSRISSAGECDSSAVG